MKSSSAVLADKSIGLIVPPAHGRVPPEAAQMYPDLRFIAKGLALASIDQSGYDQVIDHVVGKAKSLAADGVSAVSLMGTSLSFYRGTNFNHELKEEMEQATGLPCSTMSYAILRGMQTLGMRKIVLASAYVDDVNARLVEFLIGQGIAVTGAKGLGITDVKKVQETTTGTLVDLCLDAWKEFGPADGILLSCGGLATLETILQVEQSLDVPLVSSSPAGFWDIVGVTGLNRQVQGAGRLAACK
jgi:arylmalonate decarboxylase